MKETIKKVKISLIAAIDNKNGIGRDNGLIFHNPVDMKRFRDLTRNHVVVMGRKQYESKEQGGKPLPNKINIIITHDKNYLAPGAVITKSIEEALDKASELEKEEIFIIGGGQIFKETIDLADKLYLTIVDADLNAEVFFPDYSKFNKVIFKEEHKDENYRFIFLDLEH